jgi:transposase
MLFYFNKLTNKGMLKSSNQPTQNPLAILNAHAAGIDIGSMLMMVSYTDPSGQQKLLESTGYSEDLIKLAKTLKSEGITDVAMEATGVYWMAVYEVLEQAGLKVTLTNPGHFKNVAAQKTDVKDCQWLHQLHAHGLLRSSHIAPELYRELKTYIHERNILQSMKSDTLNRIHKILTQMNIKVQHIISDIEGAAGMKLLRGIASGITDPEKLLSLVNTKLKATTEELLQSLKGLHKKHYTVILQNQLEVFDFLKGKMKSYELLIEDVLKKMMPSAEDGSIPEIKKKKSYTRKNEYSINLKGYLERILGVDITAVEGLKEISVLEIISVTGIDMAKWKTSEHFTSWLNLSPRPKISGGKLLGHEKRFTNNKATQAFRLAAQTMWQNKGPLGQLYKRLAVRKGSKKAIKAVARKLAVIFYKMVKEKCAYDKTRLEYSPEQQQARKIAMLQREASKYGYDLQPVTA